MEAIKQEVIPAPWNSNDVVHNEQAPSVTSSHLPQEEHEVSHSVDCGDAQSVFHQDNEGITRGRAETGAVDGCRCICILGNKNTGETVTGRRSRTRGEEEEESFCVT